MHPCGAAAPPLVGAGAAPGATLGPLLLQRSLYSFTCTEFFLLTALPLPTLFLRLPVGSSLNICNLSDFNHLIPGFQLSLKEQSLRGSKDAYAVQTTYLCSTSGRWLSQEISVREPPYFHGGCSPSPLGQQPCGVGEPTPLHPCFAIGLSQRVQAFSLTTEMGPRNVLSDPKPSSCSMVVRETPAFLQI